MEELWLDIPDYENKYQISNLGRVRSLMVWDVSHRQYVSRKSPLILAPNDNGHGYKQIMLRKNGKKKPFYIHRLVAEAFCENPEKKPTINHLDHNRSNNRADNLQWCTQKENVRYSSYLMRHPKKIAPSKVTNEHYIRFKNGRYEVVVHLKYIGRFTSLPDAIVARDKYLEGGGWYGEVNH